MSKSTTSGSTQVWASGQENQKFSVYFDQHSTSATSKDIQVDNDFYRLMAFNLSTNETVTIEQVTGNGSTYIADFAPVSGAVALSPKRTSYVIEKPGRYRLHLNASLGHVLVIGFRYAMENESYQDIVTAINILAANFPLPLAVKQTATVSPDITGNILRENVRISAAANNEIVANADGIYAPTASGTTPCGMGPLLAEGIFTPGVGDFNGLGNVVSKDGSNCLTENQFISSGAGNLLQLRSDGVYYGILPPDRFLNQYVAVAAHGGNDSNLGTPASPLLTIQKAISNLPNGTMGNIYLYAGDTFHTYATAVTDVINTLTLQQSVQSAIEIENRQINFYPWYSTGTAGDDVPTTAIANYNGVHGTTFDAFVAAETNFPSIQITISNPTDVPGFYIPLCFNLGTTGSLTFNAINVSMGQIGVVNPSYPIGGVNGGGTVFFHGGQLHISNVTTIGGPAPSGNQNVAFRQTVISDHVTPSTPPVFCTPSESYTYNTRVASAGGTLIVPSLSYTNNADNAETYLTPSSMWPTIVVYSTATRAYRNVVTSIAIV